MLFIKPRPFILLVTLLFVALTVRLGIWQLDRGHQRSALDAQRALQDRQPVMDWHGELGEQIWQRKVRVHGTWYGIGQILLDNRPHNDTPGYEVLTPLLLDDGRLMPVMRGWLPRSASGVPQVPAPVGEVSLVVRLSSPTQRYLQLSNETTSGAVWQNLDWQAYATFVKHPLVGALAYQLDGSDTLVRDWPQPGVGAERNFMYAGQWFLFAALALVLFITLHWKRSPR